MNRYWASSGHASMSAKYATKKVISNYFAGQFGNTKERKRIVDAVSNMVPDMTIVIIPGIAITTSDKIRRDRILRSQVVDKMANQDVPCVITAQLENKEYFFDHYSKEQFMEMMNV